jgi:hypothetical protein
MDYEPVTTMQIEDGEKFLAQLTSLGVWPKAAFWAVKSGDDTCFLYVTTDLLEVQGPSSVYGRVRQALKGSGAQWLSESDVSLVSEQDPLSREILDVISRYTIPLSTWYGGTKLGSSIVNRAYIYSPKLYQQDKSTG